MKSAELEHSKTVYARMEDTAYTDDVGNLIWEGFTTKLFSELGLSVPLYSQVTTALKRMGCIEQLRRGAKNLPSQWILLTEPTDELFANSIKPSRNAFGGVKVQDQLFAKMRALEDRIVTLEEAIGLVEMQMPVSFSGRLHSKQ